MANPTLHRVFLAIATVILTAAGTYAVEPRSERDCCSAASAAEGLPFAEVQASTVGYASTSKFLPYLLMSGRSGMYSQSLGIAERASITRSISPQPRFSWGFGAEAVAELTKPIGYDRYDAATQTFESIGRRPAPVRLQQLWAGVKWRSAWIEFGMKENVRSIFDFGLGVGDIVMSRNARPIPQLRLGLLNFEPVPFTRGVLQVQAEIAYGKFTDDSWLRKHYNYYNSFITTDVWMHYKQLYLRVQPSRRVWFTIGMQHAAQFGGIRRTYEAGREAYVEGARVTARDFLDAFLQKRGGSGSHIGDRAYYNGNHLGSWDVQLTWRIRGANRLTLLAQMPWEDGSGIGKLNGWDGRWGVRFEFPLGGALEAVQAEYVDFTNQSGPIHWAPGDWPGTAIGGEATGADDYYNNAFYNGWANYGMAIGTPFAQQPIYNTDGYMRFTDTRVRGFQIGAEGKLGSRVDWRAIVAWRQSLGTPFEPRPKRVQTTSVLGEATWSIPRLPLRLRVAASFDAGSLTQAGFGIMAGLEYSLQIPRTR